MRRGGAIPDSLIFVYSAAAQIYVLYAAVRAFTDGNLPLTGLKPHAGGVGYGLVFLLLGTPILEFVFYLAGLLVTLPFAVVAATRQPVRVRPQTSKVASAIGLPTRPFAPQPPPPTPARSTGPVVPDWAVDSVIESQDLTEPFRPVPSLQTPKRRRLLAIRAAYRDGVLTRTEAIAKTWDHLEAYGANPDLCEALIDGQLDEALGRGL